MMRPAGKGRPGAERADESQRSCNISCTEILVKPQAHGLAPAGGKKEEETGKPYMEDTLSTESCRSQQLLLEKCPPQCS